MATDMLKIDRVMHCGIMVDYKCTAACRHCMYSCSPTRTGGYITEKTTESVAVLLRSVGCRSVHIGGGEPFIDFDGLVNHVRILTDAGISVEYIETNAYWATDTELCKKRLQELLRAGADTLCISVDPYHAEYVPLERPLSLVKICHSIGFGFFLWQDRFLPMMSRLDKSKKHTRLEMEELISPRYIIETARSYGIGYGGRAIGIEAEHYSCKPVADIIENTPCRKLLSGGHFHIDVHGNYIPPGCTGFTIPLSEIFSGLPDGKYPVFETLLTGGLKSLYEYAKTKGFKANAEGYPSGCTFCFHIRHWLCENAPSPELDLEHYTESLKYW